MITVVPSLGLRSEFGRPLVGAHALGNAVPGTEREPARVKRKRPFGPLADVAERCGRLSQRLGTRVGFGARLPSSVWMAERTSAWTVDSSSRATCWSCRFIDLGVRMARRTTSSSMVCFLAAGTAVSSLFLGRRNGRPRVPLQKDLHQVLPIDLSGILREHVSKAISIVSQHFAVFQLQQSPNGGAAMRRAWKAAASAAAMLAALAACSGGSGGASDPSSAIVTSTVSSSTTAPVASSSTTSSTSTTSTTVATTTSLAPTMTTTTTAAPPEAQVEANYRQLYEQYWICLRSPAACDPSVLTASVGPARAALTKTVAGLVAGELFAGAEDPGYVVVESVAVSDSTTALVTSCWWDTGVLYGPPAQPGGPPLIINDLRATSRFQTTMTLEGGRWLTSEERRVSRVEGKNQCPPES